MSLVERALKKIQESRGAVPPPMTPPVMRPSAATPAVMPAPVVAERAIDHTRPLAESLRPSRTVLIDRDALRAAQILPPASQERQLTNDYRHIKRPLVARALGRSETRQQNGHLIMLASAMPGDGKTFTSINLALSLAQEKDISVVLVDADVAKPHISKIFHVEDEPGLLDVLRDERLDIESVVLPTDIPGMSILPAGKASDTATELLASARMQHIVAVLGARDPNRIVLFDSPPLLLTSESRVLSTVVGQIVLVVRAGVTPQRAVLDAIDLLGEGKSVNLVLNQSDENGPQGYYEYYGQDGESSGR